MYSRRSVFILWMTLALVLPAGAARAEGHAATAGANKITAPGRPINPKSDSGILDQLPGATYAEKLANLSKFYGTIEGETLAQKWKVISALMALFPKGYQASSVDPAELKKIYPVLEALAGKDGYFNRRDVDPITETLLSRELDEKFLHALLGKLESPLLRTAVEKLLEQMKPTTHEESGLGALMGNLLQLYPDALRATVHTKLGEMIRERLHSSMDELGVKASDPDEIADGPAQRTLPVEMILDKIFEKGAQGLAASTPGNLGEAIRQRKIKFPEGIPVRKLAPYFLKGQIPTDLKIGLDEEGALTFR